MVDDVDHAFRLSYIRDRHGGNATVFVGESELSALGLGNEHRTAGAD